VTGEEQRMADEVEVQDAPADSSSASDPNGQPTPPAATQPGTPGKPQGQQPPGPIPYERFHEVIGQNQQLRQAVAQMQGRIQQMESLSQKAQTRGGLSAEDARTYQEAATALKQIFSADPELKTLLEMMKNGQQLMGTQQTVQSLQQAQLRQMEQHGVQRILSAADTENLPKDDNFRRVLVKTVEALALTIPQAKERFAQGDLTVLDEAFELAKPFLAQIKREGQTQLLDTKNRTRQLPPAPRGSAAGPPGLPKLDPNNPRAFESALHQAAAKHLGA
jgi:hypothetical protein